MRFVFLPFVILLFVYSVFLVFVMPKMGLSLLVLLGLAWLIKWLETTVKKYRKRMKDGSGK